MPSPILCISPCKTSLLFLLLIFLTTTAAASAEPSTHLPFLLSNRPHRLAKLWQLQRGPPPLVRRFFPPGTPSRHITPHIYRLSNDNRTLTAFAPTGRVKLYLPAPSLHSAKCDTRSHNHISLSVDGNVHQPPGASQRLQTTHCTWRHDANGGDNPPSIIRATYGSDGTLLAVYDRSRSLGPVHLRKYTSLYIDHAAAANGALLGGDHHKGAQVSSSGETASRPLGSTILSRQKNWKCTNSSTPRYMQIAVTYDSALCDNFDFDVNLVGEYIAGLFSEAERAYALRTCIRLNVTSINGHCDAGSDPYQRHVIHDSSTKILEAFCRRYETSVQDTGRPSFGVGYLMTLYGGNDNVVGTAYVDGACKGSRPCAWGRSLDSIVTAHELGHTLSASHTHQDRDIMNIRYSKEMPRVFASKSVREMRTFVNGKNCGFTNGKVGSGGGRGGGDGGGGGGSGGGGGHNNGGGADGGQNEDTNGAGSGSEDKGDGNRWLNVRTIAIAAAGGLALVVVAVLVAVCARRAR